MAAFSGIVAICVAILLDSVLAVRFNITDVEDCPSLHGGELPINILAIEYIKDNEDLVHILNAKYQVHTVDESERNLLIRLYMCEDKPADFCNDNLIEGDHEFFCEEARKQIGPWSMLSDAMSGPNCSHDVGIYEAKSITLDQNFLRDLNLPPEYTHYRMEVVFHIRGQMGPSGIRCCASVQFDVLP